MRFSSNNQLIEGSEGGESLSSGDELFIVVEPTNQTSERDGKQVS